MPQVFIRKTEILFPKEGKTMGKFCGTALGLTMAGAIVGMAVYMCMPARDQRHIQRSMRDAVDDLKEIVDRMS